MVNSFRARRTRALHALDDENKKGRERLSAIPFWVCISNITLAYTSSLE